VVGVPSQVPSHWQHGAAAAPSREARFDDASGGG